MPATGHGTSNDTCYDPRFFLIQFFFSFERFINRVNRKCHLPLLLRHSIEMRLDKKAWDHLHYRRISSNTAPKRDSIALITRVSVNLIFLRALNESFTVRWSAWNATNARNDHPMCQRTHLLGIECVIWRVSPTFFWSICRLVAARNTLHLVEIVRNRMTFWHLLTDAWYWNSIDGNFFFAIFSRISFPSIALATKRSNAVWILNFSFIIIRFVFSLSPVAFSPLIPILRYLALCAIDRSTDW